MSEFPLNNLTPLMRQYFEIKEQKPDILLLMRVGDFYEAYGEDAKTIARDLEITLTGREDKMAGERIPMAGVPHHAVERYMARLLQKGHKVALCDQVEDPKLAKGLVKRKVTRIVTPGTVMEDALLEAKRNNFLVAAITGERMPSGIGVLDVSTGEFLTGEVELTENGGSDALNCNQRLVDEIARLQPAECLIHPEMEEELAEPIRQATGATVTIHDTRDLRRTSRQQLLDHFGTQSLRGFGCEEMSAGLDAAALLLDYVRQTHAGALPHIRTLGVYSSEGTMILDTATRRNLELTQSQIDGSRAKSLLHLLDRTVTPQGGRRMRRWLEQPLLSLEKIKLRQDGVADFVKDAILRGDARDALHGIADLERLSARACAGMANARNLVALRSSLESIESLATALERAPEGSVLIPLRERLSDAPVGLAKLLATAIEDEPPITLRDGGLIKRGYSDELDRLRELRSGGKAFIAAIEEEERRKTGIKSLKVGYNNVFGYYIEISKAFSEKIPPEYIRKQTTTNAERYITPALKEHEAQVLSAQERIVEMEYDLFVKIREQVADKYAHSLVKLSQAAARCDTLAGLAEVAAFSGYVRPEVNDANIISLRNARHPVVEQLQSGTLFVPNDSYIDDNEQRLHIITGPNAAGKSTYLRQVAICVLLAQIGSFVPADAAVIGLVDRIFTRVGAQDDLASGQSTFMVEMSETANILNNATARSLVILDEVGRGTSTYDGLALAWSIAEYLHLIGAKTLFATHYHQLNELEKILPGAKNYRIAVKEQGHHIVWLRKIMPGGTDKSYGIQVARLAGLPEAALARASDILKGLEAGHRNGGGKPPDEMIAARTKRVQLTMFETERHPVLDELTALELETLSPIEALTKLYELQKKAKAP